MTSLVGRPHGGWPATPGAGAEAGRPVGDRDRLVALLLAILFLAVAVVVFPAQRAAAAGQPSRTALSLCSVAEWRADISGCVDRLAAAPTCLQAPSPSSPDSGFAGWFASRPDSSRVPGIVGVYSHFGYAGYSYETYDAGCLETLTHPDTKFENTVANGEFMLAAAVMGAANALRERAWVPGLMWGWADPLVDKATKAIYRQVFTVFGALSLAIVGLYLLWRSRQAQLSAAMTAAGWAVLVMVVVTALAAWPVFSAHAADRTLVGSLDLVHSAIGPPVEDIPPALCKVPNPAACKDHRTPAIRASDTAVETMLYRNWLRGLLGSDDSLTAQKYGRALYEAKSFSWAEQASIHADPSIRDQVIARKAAQWNKVAGQIKVEDPEAYEYLTGSKGTERIGAGLIALLASVLFGFFDLVASLLVLLGFLLFRWAVIAAPLLGTVAILRPASAGFRRLANAVVAAIFNIVIFGTGAAIYLFAVDLIMNTASLPGWLQVVLVGLCGAVGWLLLRPFRRLTQLAGGSSPTAVALASKPRAAEPAPGGAETVASGPAVQRTELRAEAPAEVVASAPARNRLPAPVGAGWEEPRYAAEPHPTFYRPERRPAAVPMVSSAGPARRLEARQDGG